MKLFDPNPQLRWLFCLTHPDDELSICAWIRRCVENGNPVYLSWTHHTESREREARRLAGLLGVPSENLFFHGGGDQFVCDQMAELRPSFAQMMAAVKPDRVACGAFEQGHIDHDATNFLVSETFSGIILEIPFYHTYLSRLQVLNRFSDPSGEEILALTTAEEQLKIRAAQCFPTQTIWRIVVWYERVHRWIGRPVHLYRTERMREKLSFDFRRPNHPAGLAARVAQCPIWHRWLKALDEYEATL